MVIAGGDSFTAHVLDEYLAWPNHLDGTTVKKCAEMASSNELIARNVIGALSVYPDAKIVIIGWSDPNRFELFFNDTHCYWKKIINFFKDKTALCSLTHVSAPSRWLKSGGGYGVWKFGLGIVDSLFTTFLQHFHTEELQYIKTLESILRIQWYCKANNINFINFKAWDHSLFNVSYDSTAHLEKLIDKEAWWFPEEHKGMREWVTDIVKLENIQDGSHPSANSQKMFAEKIIKPMIEKYNA